MHCTYVYMNGMCVYACVRALGATASNKIWITIFVRFHNFSKNQPKTNSARKRKKKREKVIIHFSCNTYNRRRSSRFMNFLRRKLIYLFTFFDVLLHCFIVFKWERDVRAYLGMLCVAYIRNQQPTRTLI